MYKSVQTFFYFVDSNYYSLEIHQYNSDIQYLFMYYTRSSYHFVVIIIITKTLITLHVTAVQHT